MPTQRNVVVLVGSLRKESFTRKVAKTLFTLAPTWLSFEIVDIGSVSHYNQDLEANPPREWVAFRETVRAADAGPGAVISVSQGPSPASAPIITCANRSFF